MGDRFYEEEKEEEKMITLSKFEAGWNIFGKVLAEISVVLGAIFISVIFFKHSESILSDKTILGIGILMVIFSVLVRFYIKNKENKF